MMSNPHPICQFLFHEMEKQGVSKSAMHGLSGVHRRTIRRWQTRGGPQLDNIEACLNVVGYTLKPVPMKGEQS